jgi:4-oxalocrotonate tautomerase
MPLVEITLTTGREPELLRGLMGEVHEAVMRAIGVPATSVRVVLREVPPEHWLSGGITIAERSST